MRAMGRIEDTIRRNAELAAQGVPMLDAGYTAAFRLKHFGRCPRCDEKALIRWEEPPYGVQEIVCRRCGWNFKYSDVDIIRAEDPDDIVLEAARRH